MGRLEFFHEVIDRRTALMIFGAGRDAVPLAELAAELGWHVSLIDHRPARASKDLFPTVDRFIVSRPEDLPTDGFAENGSAAVLMNHNLNMDREILSRLIRSNARYIAVLGPKDRAEKMLAEISEAGPEVTEDQLEKIYAPAGLDIGAPTPSTIALSIVAEIQAVFAGREGGFLRNRQGSIYDR
jgi:xanthine/CO dehydrogenase XdhC/CoxF family maturation factor